MVSKINDEFYYNSALYFLPIHKNGLRLFNAHLVAYSLIKNVDAQHKSVYDGGYS